jgi:hypothetical protein
MENLTKLQQELINCLISEFTKINPKPSNSKTRFSIDTINECLKEEERFKQTITKHNLKMIDLYVNQLKSDVKEFEKEFGKVLKIKLGVESVTNQRNTLEKMIEGSKYAILNNCSHYETSLYFVSKSKPFQNDSRYNYFNYAYHQIFVDFKREKVNLTLESGKEINVYKIVGLQYHTKDYLKRDSGVSFSSLDELVQTDKPTQQALINLSYYNK